MTENNQPDVGPYRQRFSQIATMMRLPHVEDATGLDPACCPGTGHPEPGGIAMREMNAIMRGCRGIDMIGGEVSEVSPPFDTSGMTALNAAHLLFDMLCLTAEAIDRRRKG